MRTTDVKSIAESISLSVASLRNSACNSSPFSVERVVARGFASDARGELLKHTIEAAKIGMVVVSLELDVEQQRVHDRARERGCGGVVELSCEHARRLGSE